MVDVVALVQVDGAGELLDVDHVGQLRLREAQDGERPPAAACPPAWNGMICSRMLGFLAASISASIWPPHDLGATDRPAQHGLVDDRPQLRRLDPVEDLLALPAQLDPAVDLVGGAPAWPSRMTARAYSGVCSRPGTNWISYVRISVAAASSPR